MTKTAENKTFIIAKLKIFSIAVGVLCAVSALCHLTGGIRALSYILGADPREIFDLTNMCQQTAEYLLLTVIMALGAVMFFRISGETSPFRHRYVRTIRIIGVLFLVTAFVPAPAAFLIGWLTGGEPAAYEALLVSFPTAAEGLLMLFIAQIIRYGAMLQQESDETL